MPDVGGSSVRPRAAHAEGNARRRECEQCEQLRELLLRERRQALDRRVDRGHRLRHRFAALGGLHGQCGFEKCRYERGDDDRRIAVEPVSRTLGLSQVFLGLILVPIVGNVAEHFSAIQFAARNRMELSLSIAANSSTQIAVFVAPLLVLISLFLHPMDLVFAPIELVTLFASSAIFAYISLDGETNWLEGVQLLAVYAIAAVSFFFLPG